MITPDQSFLNC